MPAIAVSGGLHGTENEREQEGGMWGGYMHLTGGAGERKGNFSQAANKSSAIFTVAGYRDCFCPAAGPESTAH